MPEASATQTDTGQENHQQQRRIRPSRRGAPFAFDRSRLATTTTKAIGQRSPPQRQRLFSARAFSATQSRSPFANVDDDEPQPSTSNANPQLSNHRHQRGEANKSYVIDGLEEEEHGMENDEDAMREAERSMDHSQARQLQHNGSFGGEELSDIEDIEMGDMGRRPATADGQEDTAAIAEPRLSKLPRRFQRRRRKTTKRIGEELEDLGAAEGKMDEAGNKEEGTEAMFSRQTTVEANGVSTAPAVEPPDRKENVDGNAGAKNVSPRDVQSPPNQMRKPSNLQNGSIGSATATREVPLPPRPQITVTGPSDAQPERKVEEEPQQTTPTDQANSTTSVNPSLIKGLTKSISRFRGRNRVADAAAVEQANFMSKFGMSGATGVQTTHNTISPNADTAQTQRRGKLRHLCEGLVFDANEGYFYHWNALVSTAYVYNLLVVIARIVFVELANGRLWLLWLSFDLVVDFVYLVDMFVRSRTGYLEQGLLVRDCRKIRALYVRSRQFLVDFASLLPLDYAMGVALWHQMPILRLNRLLRRERIQRFMEQTETRTSLPNAFRVGVVVWYIAVIIHWNACFYFLISEGIGLGSDGWVYGINNKQSLPDGINDTLTRRYIYSFYWSTLILTTIGEVPGPTQNLEFAFVTIDLMCGVLIFATIVGNVGSMIANISADRTDFQNRIDSIKQYMELRGVGKQLEVRVIKWFDYLWANKQGLTDAQVLKVLPDKLQAEIAMHVHFETLRKVRIFQDCEAGLLAELVLKLQLQVFSPADYVCRKGDIGREMYIVKRGMLQVVADDGVKVFATLSEGAVFGELSILNIAGSKNGNRRTANVRSVGYTDLFVLNKSDLWIALREYPEARKILINKGRELLRKDNLLDENAPEEQKTAEEISEELQSAIRVLQIRIARLIAEHTNTETKLRERIAGLEGRLRKYRALAANEH